MSFLNSLPAPNPARESVSWMLMRPTPLTYWVISNMAAGWELVLRREDGRGELRIRGDGKGLKVNFTSSSPQLRTLNPPIQMALFLPLPSWPQVLAPPHLYVLGLCGTRNYKEKDLQPLSGPEWGKEGGTDH